MGRLWRLSTGATRRGLPVYPPTGLSHAHGTGNYCLWGSERIAATTFRRLYDRGAGSLGLAITRPRWVGRSSAANKPVLIGLGKFSSRMRARSWRSVCFDMVFSSTVCVRCSGRGFALRAVLAYNCNLGSGVRRYAYMLKMWRAGEGQMLRLLHRGTPYMPSVWGTRRMFDLWLLWDDSVLNLRRTRRNRL